METNNFGQSAGICIFSSSMTEAKREALHLESICNDLGASNYINIAIKKNQNDIFITNVVTKDFVRECSPDFDTAKINIALSLDSDRSNYDWMIETLICMAISPVPFFFPNHQELLANLRMRWDVVETAKRTELAFDTSKHSRPEAFWLPDDTSGPRLRVGAEITKALEHALCPELSGQRHTFSCQRACEYLMLTGLTKELTRSNNYMLSAIEKQWQKKPLMRDDFLHSFLFERGSRDHPFPMRCYIPGGRVWFKNPDDYSSDVEGFEGSWVCYLGAGKFVNLWDKNNPYTLESKCIEIYHWRHGAIRQDCGTLLMYEDIVEDRVAQTNLDNEESDRIIKRMMKYRDPSGVYAEGGCIDFTRDSLRWVYPDTTNIKICT